MKVGLVCPYDLSAPGGVQQVTIELATELRRTGDEVTLIGAGAYASHGPGHDDDTIMVGRPFRIRANDSIVPLTLSPMSWGRVRKALADVDVVHIHEPLVPWVGWVALTVDKPTVATFHADPRGWVARAYERAPLIGRRLRRALLTAVSDTAAKAIPREWGPIAIIPNGIDVSSYRLPVGRIDRRVCFLGRDEPRKGLDVILEAWPMVREQVPLAELKVMGATRSVTEPGVEYLGRVSVGEKKRVLSSSLVYVAPNTGGESFGIVIVEGMAAGCAVVCSDLPAFRAVIGDAGRLVPVGDGRRLAEEVASLLSDLDEARALGELGAEEAKRFDWSVVGSAYRDLYQQVVS